MSTATATRRRQAKSRQSCESCGRKVPAGELFHDEASGQAICARCVDADNIDDTTRVGNKRKCHCDCGAYTNRAESTYLPGHDAKHASKVNAMLMTGKMSLDQARKVLSAPLFAKATRSI